MRIVLKALVLGAALAATPAMAAETISVTSTTADGGVTAQLYSGLVQITVSGLVSLGGPQNVDAFYIGGTPVTHDTLHQLIFGTTTLTTNNSAQDAINYIPTGMPAYNASHIYSFTLNTGTSTPSKLHFGFGDDYYGDNYGSYSVTVSQIPEAATWLEMVLGFGLLGAVSRKPRRLSAA